MVVVAFKRIPTQHHHWRDPFNHHLNLHSGKIVDMIVDMVVDMIVDMIVERIVDIMLR